jgi:hypothetical protein
MGRLIGRLGVEVQVWVVAVTHHQKKLRIPAFPKVLVAVAGTSQNRGVTSGDVARVRNSEAGSWYFYQSHVYMEYSELVLNHMTN